MKQISKIISAKLPRRDAYGSISMPVYNTVAYEFENSDVMADSFCGRSSDPDYSRVTNPTVIFFQDQVKAITGAKKVVALNSGMAAICGTIMSVAEAGKTVVGSNHLFGNTWLLLTRTLARFGVKTAMLPLTDPEIVKKEFPEDACCIFLESVTNPQLEVADIRALAEIAHSKGIPLIVDTTVVPFTRYNGKELCIDFEVVSSTKYVSGGATSVGGIIIDYGNFPEITERIHNDVLFNLGAYMTPQVAYMHILGLELLDIRYARQEGSALKVAEMLKTVPGVKLVRFPGLPDDPAHDLAKELYNGYGAMITIELEDEAHCRRMIDNIQMVRRATNLFDNKSLAIHPYSTIFGPLTVEERKEMDVLPNLIRLSIGLEDPEDIFNDLKQAIEK